MESEATSPARKGARTGADLAYDLVTTGAALCAVPLLPLLSLTRFGQHLRERLSWWPKEARSLQNPIWLHAASVGEVLAADPLIRELKRLRPGLPVLLTTTSVPGRDTARQRCAADAVALLPLDLWWLIERVVQRVQPRALVLVETELWPALVRTMAQHGIPVILASGRISPGAARRYRRIAPLVRAMLERIDLCLMQSALDAERLCALGAVPERVRVAGNLKFARQASSVLVQGRRNELAQELAERPLLAAASTHAGEEELVLEAFQRVLAEFPRTRLLLAPRRPERFAAVAGLVRQRGLVCQRRSELGSSVADETQVVLLDTVGELVEFLPAAIGVFVGGTFVPEIGGHNVIEPAIFGRAVCFGPYTAQVAEAAEQLLAEGAGACVTSAADLAELWGQWLRDPQQAAAMGEKGRGVVARQTEVARRLAEAICHHLEGTLTGP